MEISRKLLWKLCLSIGLGTVMLVYLVAHISDLVERQMSMVSTADRAEMRAWGDRAELLMTTGQPGELSAWLQTLQRQENTYIAVVQVREQVLAEGEVEVADRLSRVGRGLDWPIHLHHDNPRIEVPFSDGETFLVVRLPDRMLPGRWWPTAHRALHVVVPLLLMLLLSALLYRHLMRPLQQLEQATRRFSAGEYDTRVRPLLGRRRDELALLAETFDRMASRTGRLIRTQRQLIGDLSHELRTPLARLELSLDEAGDRDALHKRVRKETSAMRRLVEDTLTLAWLENEAPCLQTEAVDLTLLLEAICEDARFEYPDRTLELHLPETLQLTRSNERALSQALENIIRNALRHTPAGGCVSVTAQLLQKSCVVSVQDQGPGVPEDSLRKIFLPFFRLDKARERNAGGFGLGLALANRQIAAVGGRLSARNHPESGLSMEIELPAV